MPFDEKDLVPYHAVTLLAAGPALIFAPHPDDEVFGCGGAILAHHAAGHSITTILVTDGAMQGDSTSVRLAESNAAATLLGVPHPICWALPDRAVDYGEPLIARMVEAIQAAKARIVYAPWAGELHPDHRAVALAAREAVRRIGGDLVLAQYELSAPLRPNRLLDISSHVERKQAAMRVFASQLEFNRYDELVTALNRYRAYTLATQGVTAAEGYCVATAEALAQSPSLAMTFDPALPRAADELPLVSVMIRSSNRTTLREALDSVSAQTYSNIEIVVVNTTAKPHTQALDARFPLRLVEPGVPAPRPMAANLLLDAVRGDWLIFLDDDDWLLPTHIERLVAAVKESSALAAYADVGCADGTGKIIPGTFDQPFDLTRLHGANFLPIHAVLFSKRLVQQGCRFDESLVHFEDWDFWLQLAHLTTPRHISGVSAIYRIYSQNNSGVHDHDARVQGRQILLTKWAKRVPEVVLHAVTLRLTEAEDEFRRIHAMVDSTTEAHRNTLTVLEARTEEVRQAHAQLSDVTQQAGRLQQEYQALSADNQALGEANGVLSTQNDALTEANTQLNQQVAASSQDNQALLVAVADRETLLLAAQTQIAAKDQHIANLEAQLHVYKHSLSWRLTSPVRVFGRFVRRVLKARRLLKSAASLSGGWLGLIRRGGRVLMHEGPNGIARRVAKLRAPQASVSLPPAEEVRSEYEQWLDQYYCINADTRRAMADELATWESPPLISILMPVYNSPEVWLSRAIDTVLEQVYPHWELCIADDASTDPSVRRTLERYAARDKRIRVVFREENGHISAASNSALALCRGEFTALFDHDDELSPDALFQVVRAIRANPETDLFYSDEDKIDIRGRRFDPYFKPDWNPDLFLSQNFFSHLGVYRTSLLNEIGGFRIGFEGSQDYDLALRSIDQAGHHRVKHIPRVLYHWRVIPGSTAAGSEAKPYAYLAAVKAVEEHLARQQIAAEVLEAAPGLRMLRVRYNLPAEQPLVTIIIPTRDGRHVLARCLESIREKTRYARYEVLVIDNGSQDAETLALFEREAAAGHIRVLRDDRPFNYAALNNHGVAQVQSELICLLNDDTEVISPDWLDEMVSQVLRPGVGAVGCKLLYPDDTVQHGGVIVGLGGVAGHAHLRLGRKDYGYFGRATLQQNLSAVTAACMLMPRRVFEQVGGFNERNLAVAFNDVDLCLRIREAGYSIVWTPHALLYHHESLSRGDDLAPEKVARFTAEVTWMREHWGGKLDADPAYNPNLTLQKSDFSLAWPPRTGSILA